MRRMVCSPMTPAPFRATRGGRTFGFFKRPVQSGLTVSIVASNDNMIEPQTYCVVMLVTGNAVICHALAVNALPLPL